MQRISKVFTLMGAILALAFCLASCKANVDDDPTMYTVTVSSSIVHGKVSVDKTSAEAGATIKLTATADSGYELDSYSVKDASANELTVTNGTFTMPASNVTVSATFKETAETVNQKAAAAVIAKITAIGTVEYTDESKAKIDDARTAYDALTEAQKALVPEETLALLTAAETKYSELKAAAEQQNPSATTYTVAIASGIANGTVTASPTTAAAGTEITLTAEAASGYTFGSYTVTDADGAVVTVTDNKFTMPASNVTVSATFTALPPATASYTVKHLQQNIADNNYTLKESETKTGTVGQPTDASAKSYEGFTAQTVTQVTVSASGTVVEIKYDRKSYTVTFNTNGGSTVTSQSLRYGATATKPADPTKTATTTTEYTFADWYSDSGLTTPFSFDTAIKEDITLYAKWTETTVTPQKTAGSISYDTTSVSKTTDDTAFTNALNKTGDGTVTYASSDEAVATVNASTGEVTIVGAGTATITATVTDSASYTYATKTASYTLTVTVAVSSVIINNAPTEALFVNSTGTLTATVSPDNATDKTIVWSSSDPDYVSINAETGEYTIMGKKGYGSATITATAGDKTTTCTITGKVHHTSLQAGDIILVGETIYTGKTWYVDISPSTSFATSAGVITLVEADTNGTLYYKCSRGSNGTKPNWTSFRVTDNTDGIYIVSGSGTSSDKFVFAVHTKE